MIARRLGLLAVLALAAVALAACGASQPRRTPTLSQLPLLPGSQIMTEVRHCDRGTRAYCAIQLVVRNRRYTSSDLLAKDESHHLQKAGWSLADGDTDAETGANSPGHKLRLTYSTAAGDLEQIDLGQITRARSITLALSSSIFDRAAAMSMMLEVGAS